MRNSYIFTSLILLVLTGIVACNSQPLVDNKSGRIEFYEFHTNSKLTLEDIKESFSHQQFNLKPQMEGGFPKLNGIESNAYELIDGMVFIHNSRIM